MSILTRRTRRALLAAAVPAALAATALPASADAATARVSGGQLQYTAAPGESNDTRVVFNRTHIVIADTAPITAGDGCVIDESGDAICVPGSSPAQYSLGDGRDTMRYIPPHAARVDMGASDDTYFGALRRDFISDTNGLVVQDVDVIGGTGADLVTYRSSQGGVRVSLDNLTNDGNRGKENVRADWEHIEGSNGIDTLTGSDDPNKVEEYTGLAGNDTVKGLNGTDIFNEGPVPSGADFYAGQSGIDRINYSQRTTPVRVNMETFVADSGAAGEGDLIDPNTNDALGGSAADTMLGGVGANVFAGGRGRDTLDGNGGSDTLFGGDDPDTLLGGTDNDTLNSADTVADLLLDCESGTDDVLNRDLRDVEAFNCETVTSVGILKLAPTAITAEAGEVAKVKLSWTHPKSWKQLRKVALRLRQGEKVVGEIAIRPRAGKLEDQGAVQLVRKQSKLARNGGKVSADLAIKLAAKLADSTLDAEVVATDVKGAKQVSRAAASVRVSD
jgi:Ca2+-binding RTX toxin-like protein